MQKLPWHLPIPILVRLFNPSKVVAPHFLCIASKISPYVISSQLQIIFPYDLFDFISSFLEASSRFLNFTTFFRFGLKSSFFSTFPKISTTIFATSSAIAGAHVRPGDFIPATFINPATSKLCFTIKSLAFSFSISPVSLFFTNKFAFGLNPAKEVITLSKFILGHTLFDGRDFQVFDGVLLQQIGVDCQVLKKGL